MNKRRAELILIAMTAIWGATFPVVRALSTDYNGMEQMAFRFVLASLVLLPFHKTIRSGINAATVRLSVLLGVLLFLAYAAQTVGVTYTTSARGGFLTSLNAVFVPFFAIPILKEKSSLKKWIGLFLAFLGMLTLALDADTASEVIGKSPEDIRLGDGLVLICALLFAFHIVLITKFTTRIPTLTSAFVQMCTVGVLACCYVVLSGKPLPTFDTQLGNLLFLSLIGTGFVFIMQLKSQKYTTAISAGIIFTLEPVFATFFGWLLMDESVTPRTLVAGLFMICGVVVSLLPDRVTPREAV